MTAVSAVRYDVLYVLCVMCKHIYYYIPERSEGSRACSQILRLHPVKVGISLRNIR